MARTRAKRISFLQLLKCMTLCVLFYSFDYSLSSYIYFLGPSMFYVTVGWFSKSTPFFSFLIFSICQVLGNWLYFLSFDFSQHALIMGTQKGWKFVLKLRRFVIVTQSNTDWQENSTNIYRKRHNGSMLLICTHIHTHSLEVVYQYEKIEKNLKKNNKLRK